MGSAFKQRILGAISKVSGQAPTGSVNGSNTAFTTSSNYIAGSLEVYKNGIRLKAGSGNDYTETGTNSFTMATAPLTGAQLLVDYLVTPASSGNADTVDGLHASSTATANNLYPLNSNSQFPYDVLGTSLLGYAQASGNQTGITTVETDLTGLSVTVNVPTGGRNLIIQCIMGNGNASGGSADQFRFYYRDGTTLVGTATFAPGSVFGQAINHEIFLPNVSAGSHTYKVGVKRTNGTGSFATNYDNGSDKTIPTLLVKGS